LTLKGAIAVNGELSLRVENLKGALLALAERHPEERDFVTGFVLDLSWQGKHAPAPSVNSCECPCGCKRPTNARMSYPDKPAYWECDWCDNSMHAHDKTVHRAVQGVEAQAPGGEA
jgi:hypothetical protein